MAILFASMVENTSVAKLYLHGVGHFHPDNIIDNAFLESLNIETNHEWIMDRVGIKERRTVLSLDYIRQTQNLDPRGAIDAAVYSNAETGQRAAEKALQHAGISASQIGMVIAGGCSPDVVTPAEACTIAALLNIESPALDLNSACSSFGAQMYFLSMMDPDALPEYVLVVIPENNTRTINYTDRSTAVLWGDGTFACVISTKHISKTVITHTTMQSNPKKWEAVQIPRQGHFQQDGRAVQSFAIRQSVQCFKNLNQTQDRDMYFIGHQANLTMLQSVQSRCELSANKHLYNIDHFGNTGAAGAPTVLSQNWDKFQSGDKIGLVVVGAGLTWASMKIEFT
jgi:3-oxoacyl-[acyl-carrier-protein] synthase-3